MRAALKKAACGAAALVLAAPGTAGGAGAVRLRVQPAIYVDAAGAALKRPEGVGCGAGVLAVADTGNARVVLYTLAGDAVTAGRAIRRDELPSPVQALVDSRGEIVVLDGRLHRIARLAPTGEFRGWVSPGADGARAAVVPKSIALDGADRLWVLDAAGARILVLGPDGKTQRRIAVPPDAGFVSALAVDAGGMVFALDTVGRRVYVARAGEAVLAPLTGAMKADMAFPTALGADAQGRLFVADREGGGIVVLGSDGSFRGRPSGPGWKEGALRSPSGLCVSGAARLFVADRDNNRIQVFTIVE